MVSVPASCAIEPVSSQALVQSFTGPPGKIYLLHGDDPVFALSMQIASYVLKKGMEIAVADGGNQFDVHAITRSAQRWGRDPDEFLHRIFVSRSFTCYQMEQTVVHRLPLFLQQIHSRTAILLGLLDTFYDEQAPFREVRQILQRVLTSLYEMKSGGISILVTCADRTVWPEERNQLFAVLENSVDQVYRLDVDEEKQLQLVREEHTGLSLLHHARRGKSAMRLSAGKGEVHYGTHSANVYKHH